MAPLQLEMDDVLLVFDGTVVETFHTSYGHSFRTPGAWIAVQTAPRKHDRVRFTVARASDRGQPLYGPDVATSWTDIVFELDAADEPRLRDFFGSVAQAVGRPGPA